MIVFVAEENVIVENSGKAAEEGDDDYAKAACAVARLSVPPPLRATAARAFCLEATVVCW